MSCTPLAPAKSRLPVGGLARLPATVFAGLLSCLLACPSGDDVDGDGYRRSVDCDDQAAAVYPTAVETLDDGIDQDCDGQDLVSCWFDQDADGWGGALIYQPADACVAEGGFAPRGGDCNDRDPDTSPIADDDPQTPWREDCVGASICYEDEDGDGWAGTAAEPSRPDGACGEGQAAWPDDCDDASAAIHPGAAEVVADGVDQDCDGADHVRCWYDGDADGFGAAASPQDVSGVCTDHGALADNPDDCDDGLATRHPGADEVADDGVDQDCDGADAVTCWSVDDDGDGYGAGTLAVSIGDCGHAPPGWAADCDDGDPSVYPGAPELPGDAIDQDCDGALPGACWYDGDGDGAGYSGGAPVPVVGDCGEAGYAPAPDDCDDGDEDRHPGAVDHPDDGVDQDCDGVDAATCWPDHDGDGVGAPGPGTFVAPDRDCGSSGVLAQGFDCDDYDAAIGPGAPELPGDGVDQDCDGDDAALCYYDGDGDGWGYLGADGQPIEVLRADGLCAPADHLATRYGDCDDAHPGRAPGLTELPGDGVDQDCNPLTPP